LPQIAFLCQTPLTTIGVKKGAGLIFDTSAIAARRTAAGHFYKPANVNSLLSAITYTELWLAPTSKSFEFRYS